MFIDFDNVSIAFIKRVLSKVMIYYEIWVRVIE
jgi:hypothetical protein